MATKSNLISAINGFLTSIITITKHRNSMAEVVNEIYPTVVSDSQTTETYTTKNSNFSYSIEIIKQGRSVRIIGIYTSLMNFSLPSNVTVFELKDNEYKGTSTKIVGINCEHVPTSKIVTNSVIPPLGSSRLSISYNANS